MSQLIAPPLQHFDLKSSSLPFTPSVDQLASQMPNATLKGIAQKVIDKERLSHEEGLYLLTCEEHEAVRQLAHSARMLRCGSSSYYTTTVFIHPTNLCELSCPMCSFYAKPGWEKAWFLSPEDVEKQVQSHLKDGITEVHVVGGLWREANLDYYQEMFTRIKKLNPALHIKALTPVEYDFLAELHGIPIEKVFEKMMSWGLGSLPGGGAEILVENIRKQVAPQKIDSERFLEIHKLVHKMGLHSNITMLFGHVEEPQDIITHLEKVRDLQDETGGFQTFVPLKYHVENNALGKRHKRLKPKNIERVYSVSRLMLDNVRNLKVLWNYLGIEEGKAMLHAGANDFGSTALEERIIKMAGGVEVKMDKAGMEAQIRSMGQTPKEVHSGYDYQLDDPQLDNSRN